MGVGRWERQGYERRLWDECGGKKRNNISAKGLVLCVDQRENQMFRNCSIMLLAKDKIKLKIPLLFAFVCLKLLRANKFHLFCIFKSSFLWDGFTVSST